MVRGPRIDYPGAVHHVYGRGIEKRNIFLDDQDRRVFLKRVGTNLSRWNMRCHAWALMPNHFHFLLRSLAGELSSFMHCLMTGYSLYFNKRYNRVGHLFQNRYRSLHLSREEHYRELIRYIHLNPLRAGLIGSLSELDDYLWTGHPRVVKSHHPVWQDVEAIKEMFTDPEKSWREGYRDFLADGWRRNYIDNKLPKEEKSSHRPARRREQIGSASEPPQEFMEIVAHVSAQAGIDKEEIIGAGKKYALAGARRAVLLACHDRMSVSTAQICRWLHIPTWVGSYLVRTGKAGTRASSILPTPTEL